MLSVQELVTYCDSMYLKGDERCPDCANEGCTGACANCFKEIHFGKDRDYDCPNLMHHYVCTYFYAYSSEIWHLFNAENDLRNLDEYRVLSIGCGPASELFGISRIAAEKNIQYAGFDINERWTSIHNKVTEIVGHDPNCTADLRIGNVFDEYERLGFVPNVIVFSYLISHLLLKETSVFDFYNNLISIILNTLDKPYYIIINDINFWKIRYYFEWLYKKLESDKNQTVSATERYFQGYTYGQRYPSRQLIEEIPANILGKYSTWQECKTTAQMLIKVN